MKDIQQKFLNTGSLVVPAFAGTVSVTNACMLSLKKRRSIGWEIDPGCVTEAIL